MKNTILTIAILVSALSLSAKGIDSITNDSTGAYINFIQETVRVELNPELKSIHINDVDEFLRILDVVYNSNQGDRYSDRANHRSISKTKNGITIVSHVGILNLNDNQFNQLIEQLNNLNN